MSIHDTLVYILVHRMGQKSRLTPRNNRLERNWLCTRGNNQVERDRPCTRGNNRLERDAAPPRPSNASKRIFWALERDRPCTRGNTRLERGAAAPRPSNASKTTFGVCSLETQNHQTSTTNALPAYPFSYALIYILVHRTGQRSHPERQIPCFIVSEGLLKTVPRVALNRARGQPLGPILSNTLYMYIHIYMADASTCATPFAFLSIKLGSIEIFATSLATKIGVLAGVLIFFQKSPPFPCFRAFFKEKVFIFPVVSPFM